MMEKHCQILRRLEAAHNQQDHQQEDQEDEEHARDEDLSYI
jgi:hypothetical protein